MNISKVNKVLKQVSLWSLKQLGTVVEDDIDDYEDKYIVIELNPSDFGEDQYIKVDIIRDSYSEEETVGGIQFVQPQKVVKTDFIVL